MEHSNLQEQLKDFAEKLLDDGINIEVRMQGFSMFPTLKNGEIAQVEKCTTAQVKIGDLLVFKQKNRYIAHRLMKIQQRDGKLFLLAKGDNNYHFDPLFSENELIGKIKTVRKEAKIETITTLSYQIRKYFALRHKKLSTKFNQTHFRLFRMNEQIKEKLSFIRANYNLVSSKSNKLIIINSLLSVLLGILPFLLIICIKVLIDKLTLVNTENEHLIVGFYGILALTALVFLSNGIVSELKSFFGEKLSQSVSKRMYQEVQWKHFSLQLSHFENPKELDKIHRAVQESTYRPLKFLNELFTFEKSIASTLFLGGLFLSVKWYLAVLLLISVVPGVIIRLKFARKYHRLKNSQSTSEREMFYYNRVLTGFPFAKELKLFQFNSFFSNRFRELQKKLFGERISLRKSEINWNIASHIFSVILIFTSLAYVSLLKIQGAISIGEVVLFFFAFQRGYSVLSDLFRSITQISEDISYLNDVRSFFGIESNVGQQQNNMTLNAGITLKNVSFSYENSQREALKNINLTIPAGKTIAVVGANGSGKSTFIKLLCGFYQPAKGSIYFDSKSTAELGQMNIAKNTAAVFQDFALYNVSALQNIALGDIDKETNPELAIEAAKAAGIHDVLDKLPQGYNTILGNIFYGGEELSIGQWQKLAIARAIYRNADLLIMDEPSSALDVISEKQIMNSLQKYSKNRTSIIISHRLSTVHWADEILLFDNGEIIEQGTHAELMALHGKYEQLFLQSKNDDILTEKH
jgi:ATP-binding cassette, subfamily B, bacterial